MAGTAARHASLPAASLHQSTDSREWISHPSSDESHSNDNHTSGSSNNLTSSLSSRGRRPSLFRRLGNALASAPSANRQQPQPSSQPSSQSPQLRHRRYSDPDRRVNRRGSQRSHIDQSDLNGNVDNPIPQAIQLFDLNIGDLRLLQIANGLRRNQVVKTINLSRNAFGHEGVYALAMALQEDHNVVERLTLCGNPNMGLSGVTALAHAVPHCSQLRALNLSQNHIGNAGCHALAHALTQPSTQLQELLLHSNRIGNEGAAVLATAMARNHTLQNMDLSDNVFGDDGMGALAVGLQSNTCLRRFYVGDNRYSTIGIQALLQLVQTSNTTLVAIHAKLRQEPKSKQQEHVVVELLEHIAFYLSMNEHGRSWMRSEQPNPALLPYVLQPLTTTVISMDRDHMPLVYGLLRELPHVWCSCHRG